MQTLRRFVQLRQDGLMTEVDAVEVADGGNAAPVTGTQIVLTADEFHAVQSTRDFMKCVIIRGERDFWRVADGYAACPAMTMGVETGGRGAAARASLMRG